MEYSNGTAHTSWSYDSIGYSYIVINETDPSLAGQTINVVFKLAYSTLLDLNPIKIIFMPSNGFTSVSPIIEVQVQGTIVFNHTMPDYVPQTGTSTLAMIIPTNSY